MRYRTRPEIQAAILEAARGGANKTKLMYRGCLTYYQITAYLKDLLEIGMLEYDYSEELYRTSTKGIDFLLVYRQMVELVEI